MDHSLRRERLDRRLGEDRIGGALVTKAENVRYLSGFTGSAGVLLVSGGEPALIVDGRYEEQARREADGVRILGTRSGLLEAAAGAARDRGLERLGIEETLAVRDWRRLAAAAGRIELVVLEGSVERLRATKDAGELAKLERAQACTELAVATVADGLAEGVREREVALELEVAMRRAGAEAAAFEPIVAFGEQAAEPHHRPGERPLRRGDVIEIDVGARVDGYHADMTRMFALGEPPGELRAIHEIVDRAHRAASEAARAGVAAGELDRAARSVIEAAGYGDRFAHPLGHGVGLEVHEWPTLRTGSSEPIPAGAVITIEPGVYVPGLGGARIEDMVLLEPGGARSLGRSTHDLRVL